MRIIRAKAKQVNQTWLRLREVVVNAKPEAMMLKSDKVMIICAINVNPKDWNKIMKEIEKSGRNSIDVFSAKGI